MSDAPYFPPPGEKSPYREPVAAPAERASSPAAEVASSPRVVTRAEPPDEGVAAPKAGRPKLTQEEIKALISMGGAEHQSKWGKVGRRTGYVLVPTGLLQFLAHHLVGGMSGWALDFAIGIAALVWIAKPLWRKSDFA